MAIRSLLHLLTVLAFVLAPFGMLGGHVPQAQAAPQAGSASGHCAEMGGQPADDERGPVRSIDCMIACACMPPAAPALAAALTTLVAPGFAFIVRRGHGLNPAAEPPPPRAA